MEFFRRQRTYGISPDRDDWVTPEETLVDSASPMADVEVPVSDTLFSVAGMLVLCCALVLVGATAWLTVGQYGALAQLSARNRTVNVSVPPPRGIIMDRTGIPLVQNEPSFDLLVISRQLRGDAIGAEELGRVGVVLGYDAASFRDDVLEDALRNAVFFVATDISRDQVLSLRTILPSGFYLITSTKRRYPDGQQFSHIVGYVGKVSKQDMAKDSYYLPSDTVGRLGIEAQYETILRGSHGQLLFETSDATRNEAAQPGANVVLALDEPAQKRLYAAVWDILREAGLSQAAAIAQDPRDGSVLAMVSFPSYDNNVFTGPRLTQEDFEALFLSERRPLFNRVIAGRYNPGSTIKPFIGLTAMQENVVSADDVVTTDCTGITIPNPTDPDSPYVFGNWRPDIGPFALDRAIADSCNVYFYTVGGGYGSIRGLGVERIVAYLKNVFADVVLGIDLPGEEQGFVPTPDWKYATTKEGWYQGDTYNISIGQGDLTVTPLWLNTMVSAIANGGTIYRPRMATRIVDDQRNTLGTLDAQVLGELPYGPNVLRRMQQAMRRTVTDGTARILQDVPVSVAAKTGTAEVIKGRRINSLVTLWAPADDPQIALTVLIEGSQSNQGYALRVARQFLQWYFGGRTDPTPAPVPTATPTPEPTPSLMPVTAP